jgi:hypothetical protein
VVGIVETMRVEVSHAKRRAVARSLTHSILGWPTQLLFARTD